MYDATDTLNSVDFKMNDTSQMGEDGDQDDDDKDFYVLIGIAQFPVEEVYKHIVRSNGAIF